MTMFYTIVGAVTVAYGITTALIKLDRGYRK